MAKRFVATFVAEVKKKNHKSVNFVKFRHSRIGAKFVFLAMLILAGISLFAWPAFAHEVERSTEEIVRTTTWWIVGLSATFILIVLLLTLAERHRSNRSKWLFFILLIIPITLTTLYLASSTIFLNLLSETKGPVHWHAEYIIFACGEKLDLLDPSGLSNRIGTPLFHEHGDNWIHIEGVPFNKDDVSLHHFFAAIGGQLQKDRMLYPTVAGPVYVENGDKCPDGTVGSLQVFVYGVKDKLIEQRKIDDFPDYVLSPHATVPPGDCIIIEFGEPKEDTEFLCPQYELAIQKGELNLQ